MTDGPRTEADLIETALHMQKRRAPWREKERSHDLPGQPVTEVLWTTDLHLRATGVSPSVSRLLGYSVEEAVHRGMAELLTAPSLEAARRTVASLQAAAETDRDSPAERERVPLAFVSSDGTRTEADALVSLLHQADGRPGALLWVIRDATEGGPAGREPALSQRHSTPGTGRASQRRGTNAATHETKRDLEHGLQERIKALERTNAQLKRALDEHRGAEAKLDELNREWLSLQAAAVATASSLDLQFVLETVTWEMTKLLQVEGCAIFHWNREADTVSVIADHGSPRGQITKGRAYSLSDYALRQHVLTEQSAQQVTLDETARLDGERTYMQEGHIQSLLMLPMIYQDRVIGLVEMRSLRANRVFSDREISLAQMLSTEAASAIENARLYRRAQREIAQRRQVEDELKASLQEKEALLQEIHHRVKNNLQVICSLLNLQSRSIEDPDTLQMFRESQDRVRSMALIHEKLYHARDMSRVDFGDYLRNLARHLVQSYRSKTSQVELIVAADDVHLSLDQAVPCGLITNELISNAMKHAFRHGRDGEIHVSLRSNADHQLTLSVADNGVGLPADMDVEGKETLGLQLIKVLTSQLGGTTEVHSSQEDGTEVRVTFAAS